jgi:hypothetical protein
MNSRQNTAATSQTTEKPVEPPESVQASVTINGAMLHRTRVAAANGIAFAARHHTSSQWGRYRP